MQHPLVRDHSALWRGPLADLAPQQPMKTILYLEDDEHDIFFLKRALTTQAPDIGLQHVTSFRDATAYLEGIEAYCERDRFPFPDLVISDISIPGGSGFQFAQWIRDHRRFSALPVILLTGSAPEGHVERGLSSGANYCLEKSTDFTLVLRKIRELLEATGKN